MKKLMLISAWAFCLACNNSGPDDGATGTIPDSSANERAAQPTPGVGNDPSRNDATKENPIGPAVDSSNVKDNARPTPGVGSEPTRSTTNPPSDKKPRN